MARVEEDAKELVAEAAGDDLVRSTTGLTDSESAVPLGDRLEVRPDQSLGVVTDPGGQLGGVFDNEACPAVQRAPDPECDGETVAPLDPPVTGTQQTI